MSEPYRVSGQGNVQECPRSRYVVPSFLERTTYGTKEMDPYNKLFEERIIYLGIQVDDASANDVIAQLIALESMDPERDVVIYLNSPGGSFTACMAMYDTMQYIRPEIQTVCTGQAAGAAAVLLAAGTKGKRLGLPNARMLLHQPSGAAQGQTSDLEIQAQEIMRMRGFVKGSSPSTPGNRGAGPHRHRARQHHGLRGRQGLWPHRRDPDEPKDNPRGHLDGGLVDERWRAACRDTPSATAIRVQLRPCARAISTASVSRASASARASAAWAPRRVDPRCPRVSIEVETTV